MVKPVEVTLLLSPIKICFGETILNTFSKGLNIFKCLK